MSFKLRYDFAGALGRLYRTRTEILGVAEIAVAEAGDPPDASPFDPADIPEGTPRAVWLTTLVKLANAGRWNAIGKLIKGAEARSVEEKWDIYWPLAHPSAPKEKDEVEAPSKYVHAELDIRWSGEKGEERQRTMVASTRVWLEVTVTLTWDAMRPDLDLASMLVCDDTPVRLWQVNVTSSDETNVATFRGIHSITPVLWKTKTVTVEWKGPGHGDDTHGQRRLIHRKAARAANVLWLFAVGVFPLIWLQPLGFLPTMIVSLGGTSLAGVVAFGVRVLDTAGLRAWIRETLASLRRALLGMALSAALVIGLTPFVFHRVWNATNKPIDLGDGTVVPAGKTETRWFWEKETITLPFEQCICGECACSEEASRWATRSKVTCAGGDCIDAHAKLEGGGKQIGTVTYPHGLDTRDIGLDVEAASFWMHARGDDTDVSMLRAGDPSQKPSATLTMNFIDTGFIEPIHVPVPRGKLTLEFVEAGTLSCGSSAARILPVEVDRDGADLLAFQGELGGTTFSWTWTPGSTKRARICAGTKDATASFSGLRIASCTGTFHRLGSIVVTPADGGITFRSDDVETQWKAQASKANADDGRGWVCLSRSDKLTIHSQLAVKTHFFLPASIRELTLVDASEPDKPTTVPCGRHAWIVSLPPDPPKRIKDVNVHRLRDGEIGVACSNSGPNTNRSEPKGERTCSVDDQRVACTSSGVRHRGDCVLTGGNQIVPWKAATGTSPRRPPPQCGATPSIVTDDVASTVTTDARKLGLVCAKVFRCE